ncbi:MAG: DUF6917 domain-containing protein [bacterium]|jgi:hypothetical protein|nr:hypothetical protein [Betaproteobacteria bacterium]
MGDARGKGTRGYPVRDPLDAIFVGVLDNRNDSRALKLIHERTRCVRRFEIHELILTDEAHAAPGTTVGGVHYLGFVEFQAGGVLMEGDRLMIGDECIGTLAGFDETHFPNHYNVLFTGPRRITGVELGQRPGDRLRLIPA